MMRGRDPSLPCMMSVIGGAQNLNSMLSLPPRTWATETPAIRALSLKSHLIEYFA